jgi:hypothetical protein
MIVGFRVGFRVCHKSKLWGCFWCYKCVDNPMNNSCHSITLSFVLEFGNQIKPYHTISHTHTKWVHLWRNGLLSQNSEGTLFQMSHHVQWVCPHKSSYQPIPTTQMKSKLCYFKKSLQTTNYFRCKK